MIAPRGHGERGAALLTVLVAVAVLTAVATDLAYESRVSLRIAANARDELRASYEARSGVAMSRLVLSFQQQLDGPPQMVAAGGVAVPRIQLWKLVPVASDLVAGLFGGGKGLFASPDAAAGGGGGGLFAGSLFGPEAPSTTAKGERRARAGAPSFDAVIEDEGTKVNAQLEAFGSESMAGIQLLALYQLICDSRWDPLFDREDANGVKTSREELLVRLKEWVDIENTTWELKASFGTASCTMVPGAPPFVKNFGDKNAPYDRGDDRYKTKTAHLDSLDELYQVAGVGDAFMAAFRDQLTAYLPRSAKINLNDLSRAGLLRNAAMFAEKTARNLVRLADPKFPDVLQEIVMKQAPLGVVTISPQQFATAVALAGVTVDTRVATDTKLFTDVGTTFRIKSTGTAGDVKTTIEAIVALDPQQQQSPAQLVQAQAAGAPGRVIHWREE